jgi:hypothetical protein
MLKLKEVCSLAERKESGNELVREGERRKSLESTGGGVSLGQAVDLLLAERSRDSENG